MLIPTICMTHACQSCPGLLLSPLVHVPKSTYKAPPSPVSPKRHVEQEFARHSHNSTGIILYGEEMASLKCIGWYSFLQENGWDQEIRLRDGESNSSLI